MRKCTEASRGTISCTRACAHAYSTDGERRRPGGKTDSRRRRQRTENIADHEVLSPKSLFCARAAGGGLLSLTAGRRQTSPSPSFPFFRIHIKSDANSKSTAVTPCGNYTFAASLDRFSKMRSSVRATARGLGRTCKSLARAIGRGGSLDQIESCGSRAALRGAPGL
jgi:hypothetical protein